MQLYYQNREEKNYKKLTFLIFVKNVIAIKKLNKSLLHHYYLSLLMPAGLKNIDIKSKLIAGHR